MSSFDERAYRNAMSLYANGVSIVTADDGVAAHGLTASSFTSVSLAPPLLLVCVSEKSPFLPIVRSAERFALNVLRESHAPLAATFARAPAGDRLTHLERLPPTPPRLCDADGPLVRFDCTLHAEHVAGDHSILVGRPIDLEADAEGAPLVWWRGELRAAPEPSS